MAKKEVEKVKFERKLYILVANIGTGKTTYANKLVKEGCIISSKDELRKMIGNGKYMFNYLFEPIIFSAEKNILKSFMRLGVNLVVDGTNVSKFIRGKFIRLAKANNYKVTAIVFPRIKKETAIRRRMKSNHGDKDAKGWERIWEMFDEAYEKPSKKEGFSAIQYVKK